MAEKTIKIKIIMEERWIPDFIAMIKTMESFGNAEHSGWITFYSDGDGDFKPKIKKISHFKEYEEKVNEREVAAKQRAKSHWDRLKLLVSKSGEPNYMLDEGLPYQDAEFAPSRR